MHLETKQPEETIKSTQNEMKSPEIIKKQTDIFRDGQDELISPNLKRF